MNSVRNESAITLNYLLYLYNSHLNSVRGGGKYPVFKNNNFIAFEDFNSRLSTLWNEIMTVAENEENFTRRDLKHMNDGDFFRSLFAPDRSGEAFFQETKESFFAWWWPQPYGGQYILDQLSSPMVTPIYDGLKRLSKTQNNDFHDILLFAIYDQIPPMCKDKNSRCIVYTVGRPEQNLAAVDSIVDTLFLSL